MGGGDDANAGGCYHKGRRRSLIAQRNTVTSTPIDDYFEIDNSPAPGGRPFEPFKSNNLEINSRWVQLSDKSAVSHPLKEPLFTHTHRKAPPACTATSMLSEVASMNVTVFFPHATKPVNKPLKLTVRKDEVLSEEQKKEKLSVVGWVIRIAEDDGDVDEDFPGE